MRAVAALPACETPQFVECAEPAPPAAGEIVCRTLELGICGTDREILESAQPWVPPGEPHLVLGHECLAIVEAVANDVDTVSVGDLVVPFVRRALRQGVQRVDLLPFGEYTERGIVEAHGFSAPRWTDQAAHVLVVAPHLRSLAVLAEPLSVAEKGISEAELLQTARRGSETLAGSSPRVMVTGMGPIGMAAVVAARARGWPTTLVGRDDDDSFRANLARRFGAAYLKISQLPGWEPLADDGDRFDLILECTGNDRVISETIRGLASCGAMVWLGSSRNPQPRDHNLDQVVRAAVLRNHLILGSVNAAVRDLHAAVRCLDHWHRPRCQNDFGADHRPRRAGRCAVALRKSQTARYQGGRRLYLSRRPSRTRAVDEQALFGPRDTMFA